MNVPGSIGIWKNGRKSVAKVTVCDCCGRQQDGIVAVALWSGSYQEDPGAGRSERRYDYYDMCPNCIASFALMLKRQHIPDTLDEYLNTQLKAYIARKKKK
jgi:hypothetical protein